MARSRRTRFAASFVVVVAAGTTGGCGHEGKGAGGSSSGGSGGVGDRKPVREWSINAGSPSSATGAPCSASEWNLCPPDVHCNPPAPAPMDCPPGAATDGTAHIVSYDGTTCLLVPGDKPIACPSYDWKPPPPTAPPSPDAAAVAAIAAAPLRRWQFTRGADGKCEGFLDNCYDPNRKPGDPIPPCNPPSMQAMTCPPGTDPAGAIVEVAAGSCILQTPGSTCPQGAHCNPPKAPDVDCPR